MIVHINMKLGCIGQGWIGKHLSDHFEARGFTVTRYSNEKSYRGNKKEIATCDVVFIAVPTPTTPHGFDDSILREVIALVGKGKTAVIKSTVIPGTTDAIQKEHPNIIVLHAPEFLRETSVQHDIDFPDRNIIGIPSAHLHDRNYGKAAEALTAILPHAPYVSVCSAPEAELTKYAGNNFLYMKVVYMNLLYDMAQKFGADWGVLAQNMVADPRIGPSHMQPVHQYSHMGGKEGRGAGGHCFIKDFVSFRELYEKTLPDDREGIELLKSLERKNNTLLKNSGKDAELLRGVYGA